jgi:hypothetical protein
MVANRTLKMKAREYAEDFGVSYPRTLADLTAPGLGVPLHSKADRERFGFDPRTDRHLLLTGDFEGRASMLEHVFGRLHFRPGVERFIIDVTGDLAPTLSHLAEDGSEGAATTTAGAIRVLSRLIYNAAMSGVGPVVDDQVDVLAINGLPELVRASPACADMLSQLIKFGSPAQSLILAGDWIGSHPVPGGPELKAASRLHFGPLPELTGMPRPWVELDPKEEGEAIYHRRGWAAERVVFTMSAPSQ